MQITKGGFALLLGVAASAVMISALPSLKQAASAADPYRMAPAAKV